MAKLKKGLIQVYTGDGKGKTTAALGLALRASGAGLKVWFCQFIKGAPYSEILALKNIKNVRLEQFGSGCFIKGAPKTKDILLARKAFAKAWQNIMSGKYDIVILDEVNVALKLGLVDVDDMIDLMRSKPKTVELVLTGRYCPNKIIRCADLVTEMREVKHPYRKGIRARRGIEY